MIDTSLQKVKVNQVLFSQLPSFVQEENPLFVDFLKTYYESQEFRGGNVDIVQNLNEYQKVETFDINENLIGFTTCTTLVTSFDSTIEVSSTDGWPKEYGLLKIDDEIITYTGKTDTSFTGCVRGFSGVESLTSSIDPEQLVFSETSAEEHKIDTRVVNLSNLFIQEFWKKTKELFLPGFEDRTLATEVDRSNFLKQAKDFYTSKGTDRAIEILFRVLFAKEVEVIKPIEYLIAPSDADYVITQDIVAELISGDPSKIIGQQLRQTGDDFSVASIFDVKNSSKNNRPYYTISLSKDSSKGKFSITGGSVLTNNVSIGDTVLNVDSTLGFAESGSFNVGSGLTVGVATYTSKTSTQFFNVTGITSAFEEGQIVRSSNTIYSYEDGDLTKPVFFRMTAVAKGSPLTDVGYLIKNDILFAKTVGNLSLPTNVRLNDWIHNIKTKSDVSRDINTNRSNIDTVTNIVNTIDPHLLKLGDPITLLDVTGAIPDNVVGTVSQIIGSNSFKINISSGTIDTTKGYKVQLNTIFASHNSPTEYVVDKFAANVQNTYTDKSEDNVFVASGSLPAYKIYATDRKKTFPNTAVVSNKITINNHGFFTGDLVRYAPVSLGSTTIIGLSTFTNYAVTRVDDNTIRLSQSVGDASVDRYVDISAGNETANHTFVPTELSFKNIQHQNFLRRFPVDVSLNDSVPLFKNEPIGMFRNGVEIMSNQSGDSIRYGQIDDVEVQNGGQNYDVLYPPNINISDNVGSGATAYAIVDNGSFTNIEVISGGYDILSTPQIKITGGNGSGAAAVASLKENFTERLFNGDIDVNTATNTVTFLTSHLFENGESVYYTTATGFAPVGGLVDNSLYYLHVKNDTQIQFANTYDDAVAGVNLINLSSQSVGSHKLKATKVRKILDKIIVTNPGEGYSNRRAIVDNTQYPPEDYTTIDDVNSGINTSNSYVYFKKHGFDTGDLIEYNSTGAIDGLATTQNYYVLKLDEDRFRLAAAGIGSTLTSANLQKEEFVNFKSEGTNTHTFKYPDIHVSVNAVTGLANTSSSLPRVRPVCQGQIAQIPVTSAGTGYGVTDCINVHRRPNIEISNGSRGLVELVIARGEIVRAFVKDGGGGYATPPTIEVIGDGKYANLVADVSGGVITNVNIVDSGKGYTPENTTVRITTSGNGAKLIVNVKKWNIDILSKYRENINENDDGIIIPSQNENNGLKFVHAYASRKLRQVLQDNIEDDFSEKSTLTHSPILGWAYDGSPIYGPYGFTSPTGGVIKRLTSGYTLVSKGNRPPTSLYPLGTFVNDYIFTNDGDLDEFNGRFTRTPDFPDGIYAYFCTIQATNSSISPFTNTREPLFPYVLNGFKYKKDVFNTESKSLQSLDILNSGDLVRNTYYYKFGFASSQYDFLTQNQIEDTQLIVRSTKDTGISSVSIVIPGQDYQVGDLIRFNNDNSSGTGARAKIKTLVGKGLSTFNYTRKVVPDLSFTYSGDVVTGVATTAHGLSDGDLVRVGGIGTGDLQFITGPRTIGVLSVTAKLENDLERPVTTGITTTIKLATSGVSGLIETDDILGIGTERLVVLSVDDVKNTFRVRRQTGFATTHFAGTKVHVDQRKLSYTVGVKTDIVTKENRKLVFDPHSTIGFGTTATVQSVAGVGTTTVIRTIALDGTILLDHELPPAGSTADNAITILNHGFKTGQELRYEAGPGSALTVSNNLDLSDPFQLTSGQHVYAVKKNDNLVGFTTTIAGIGTTSTSLYFVILGDGREHSLRETNKEYIGHIERFDISTKTVEPHTLKSGNTIKIDLTPDTTIEKSVSYNTTARKLLLDGYYVGSASTAVGIGTTQSWLNITDHEFDSGDKVLYHAGTEAITPLVDAGEYYVQKVNDNQFRLSTNYVDSINRGSYIGITSFGAGVHKVALINPHITVTRGQTVSFAVSESSNADLELQFFEDENFVTRYDGAGISTEITRTGTPGVDGATVELKLSENVPSPLYYKYVPTNLDTINVAKRDTSPDETVDNSSKIIIEDSVFAGTFSISTTGTDTFTYQTKKAPEADSYSSSSGISTFKYTTDSPDAKGGINEVKVTFGGKGYRQNPGIATVITDNGINALMRIYDDNVGQPAETEMLKIGFEYPSDLSVQPTVDLPTVVTVSNNFVLAGVGIVTAGRNYVTPPKLIIPDNPEVELECFLSGTSIGEVVVKTVGRGFNEVPNPPRIVSTRNSNGIGIVSTSSNGQTNFLTLVQPTNGWRDDGVDFPFKVSDRIYVEGVGTAETSFTSLGGGYNSENYDYSFFSVETVNFTGSQITYSIAGLGSTGGTFDPDKSAARVIKQTDLPTFVGDLTPEPFFTGEPVTYAANGKGFVLDNEGYNPVTNTLRLRSTTSKLQVGDVIKGQLSSAEGTVRNVVEFKSFYETDYAADKSQGFQRDTGKLNDDFQKLEDSDYYQNFSYSIKSEIPIEDWKPAVDSIVHTTGYKNFSDLVVPSESAIGFARSADLRISESIPPGIANLNVQIDNVKSFLNRDDFDTAGETLIVSGDSKFINLRNKRISTFINIVSNTVDVIDDISPQFTGIGTTNSALVVGLSSFRMTSNGNVLFTKEFNPNDGVSVSAGSSIIRINNHNFQTGELIKYDPQASTGEYADNRLAIQSTNKVVGGITTDKMPAEVFAIRINSNFFSVAGLRTDAESGNSFVISGLGSGNAHSFDVLRPDDRVLLEIDEIVQSPLFRRDISIALDEAVGIASTTIKVVGVTSISVNDLVNIDNEILEIKNVGFGSTNVLKVERGVLGSVAAAHTVGAACTMRGGTYHIVKDVIHFTTPPFGKVGVTTLQPGIGTNSTFQGRSFNRKDPTTNFIFDDLGSKFTSNAGTGKTFTLTQDNADVTGIVTTVGGPEVVNEGVIMINNIFQRPGIDFVMTEKQDPGIGASIIFTGQNREDLPRGGIVDEVTIGIGSNYQSLVAAAATAIINGAGAIESVVITGGGSGYRNGPVDIQVFNPLGIGSTAVLSATVGTAGTVTGITTVSGGSGYASTNPPTIVVGVPTGYTNMSYTGGTGFNFKASVVVGSGGSIIDFKITDKGLGYRNGEVLTVAGIPTGSGGFGAHTVTINSLISDTFAGFSFGQLLPLDDFSSQFDGGQRTFTLTKTTTTKQVLNINSTNTAIDPANNLLVFLNDILQQPGQAYSFPGGTQITFSEAPKAGSKLQILFYRGSNSDVDDGNPFPTVKKGDLMQLQAFDITDAQKERRVIQIADVQKVETVLYNDIGINTDPTFTRTVSWKKQEQDLILDNQPLSKARESLIPKIIPSAQVTIPVGVNSNEIYVDHCWPTFAALDNRSTPNDVPGTGVEVIRANVIDRADADAVVSAGGTIQSTNITDPGAGYLTVPTVSFASTLPQIKEVGKTWVERNSYTDIEYRGVARNIFGIFVAVGSTSGINTSTEGIDWFPSGNTTTFGTLNAVAGMGTATVVVGASGTVGYSTNGRNFEPAKTLQRRNQFPLVFFDDVTVTQDLNDVTYGATRGVVVGAAGTILVTKPGAAGIGTAFEIVQQFATANLNGVGANGDIFVAVGDNGAILRSNNGEAWTGVTTTSISTKLNHVHYGNGQWIAVGAAGTVIRSSDQGLTWSVVSFGATFDLNRVGYANSVWVAIGTEGMVLNSVDTNNWYKRSTGDGEDINGLAFGDNKFVAVGVNSSIYTSTFEQVSAAGTATITAAGTVSGITINERGFGYNPVAPVEVLIETEPVTREIITSVEVEGDYGDVVSVATSASGIGTTKPMVIFELQSDSFLNQAGFGNIVRSGIGTGDYFVITNSTTGAGVTSIDVDNKIVGVGVTHLDSVYVVGKKEQSNTGIVTVFCNVRSISGIGTTDYAPRIGKYSWGRFYNFQRDRLSPQAFPAYAQNGSAGLSTSTTVVRISPLTENYSDFSQTS